MRSNSVLVLKYLICASSTSLSFFPFFISSLFVSICEIHRYSGSLMTSGIILRAGVPT